MKGILRNSTNNNYSNNFNINRNLNEIYSEEFSNNSLTQCLDLETKNSHVRNFNYNIYLKKKNFIFKTKHYINLEAVSCEKIA